MVSPAPATHNLRSTPPRVKKVSVTTAAFSSLSLFLSVSFLLAVLFAAAAGAATAVYLSVLNETACVDVKEDGHDFMRVTDIPTFSQAGPGR